MSLANKDSHKEVERFLTRLGEAPPQVVRDQAIARISRSLQSQEAPATPDIDLPQIDYVRPSRGWITAALLGLVCLGAIALPWKYWNALSRTKDASTVSQHRSDNAVPPRLIYRVNPRYTKEARAARIEGKIKIDCIVLKDGTVAVKKLIEGLGYGLDENAISAVKQWRYEPVKDHGQPAEFPLTITINFSFSN